MYVVEVHTKYIHKYFTYVAKTTTTTMFYSTNADNFSQVHNGFYGLTYADVWTESKRLTASVGKMGEERQRTISQLL